MARMPVFFIWLLLSAHCLHAARPTDQHRFSAAVKTNHTDPSPTDDVVELPTKMSDTLGEKDCDKSICAEIEKLKEEEGEKWHEVKVGVACLAVSGVAMGAGHIAGALHGASHVHHAAHGAHHVNHMAQAAQHLHHGAHIAEGVGSTGHVLEGVATGARLASKSAGVVAGGGAVVSSIAGGKLQAHEGTPHHGAPHCLSEPQQDRYNIAEDSKEIAESVSNVGAIVGGIAAAVCIGCLVVGTGGVGGVVLGAASAVAMGSGATKAVADHRAMKLTGSQKDMIEEEIGDLCDESIPVSDQVITDSNKVSVDETPKPTTEAVETPEPSVEVGISDSGGE